MWRDREEERKRVTALALPFRAADTSFPFLRVPLRHPVADARLLEEARQLVLVFAQLVPVRPEH